MQTNYKKIEEWAIINSKLSTEWEKCYELVRQRDEIEKEIPWLKGKGASPFPSKEKEKKEGDSMILLDEDPKRKKVPSSTEKNIKNLSVLKNVPPPPNSSLSLDVSQNFQNKTDSLY